MPWGLFLEGPGNFKACKAVLILIPDGGLKGLENIQKKLLAKEPKWTHYGARNCFSIVLMISSPLRY